MIRTLPTVASVFVFLIHGVLLAQTSPRRQTTHSALDAPATQPARDLSTIFAITPADIALTLQTDDEPMTTFASLLDGPPALLEMGALPSGAGESLVRQLDHQLLQLVRDDQIPDLNELSKIAEEDQAMLTVVLDALSAFRSTVRANSDAPRADKIRPFLEMADRLRAQAPLAITRVALCTAVSQYGVYDEIQPARFQAGQENPLIIYCEVENFTTRLNEQRAWETRLQYQATLFAAGKIGEQVWQSRQTPIVDQCRSRREDFFIADTVKLPSNLSAGRYLFKISLIDEQANQIAEATVPLSVVNE